MEERIASEPDAGRFGSRHEQGAGTIGRSEGKIDDGEKSLRAVRSTPEEVLEAMNRVVDGLDEPQLDPFVAAAARRLFDRAEW